MICRQCFKKRFLVYGAAFILCALTLKIYFFSKNLYEDLSSSCSDHDSLRFLESLCLNYTAGVVAGSICHPLCKSGEISFTRCLGHGVKLHVLEAQWQGRLIVLKTPKTLGTGVAVRMASAVVPSNVRKEDFKITATELAEHIGRYIHYNQDSIANPMSETTLRVASNLVAECDVHGDKVLSYWESLPCWQLISTDEYVLYALLNDNAATLKLHGVCGNMYAVEHATSQPFSHHTTSITDNRPWAFRAQLAISLLDMIEELENTPYGTLYLCDVQEPNFGVVKNSDGTFLAKAIDMDIAMFERNLLSQLRSERNRSCSDNSDCFVISCGSACNKDINKCTGVLTSSNLVVLCSRIFQQRHPLHPALLMNPPQEVEDELTTLLMRCSEYDQMSTDLYVLNGLRDVLRVSLNTNEDLP